MTKNERIEKLILTLKHLDNALLYLSKMEMPDTTRDAVEKLKDTVGEVIAINLDDLVDIE